MGIGAASAHLGRDRDRFHQFFWRRARPQGRLCVAVYAVGTLGHVSDGDCNDLLEFDR